MPQSDLEAAFLQAWRAFAPDAPEPVQQHMFARATHNRRWMFDFAWPRIKLAVEIDGGQWAPHGGRHNTDGDREKLNVAALLGWRVMRFSASMLASPEAVVGMVREAITEKIPSSGDTVGVRTK